MWAVQERRSALLPARPPLKGRLGPILLAIRLERIRTTNPGQARAADQRATSGQFPPGHAGRPRTSALADVKYEFVGNRITQHLRKFKMTVALGAIFGILSGVFMAAGTLLLGHVRPMWMEFIYAPPTALIGFAVGAVVGLVVDYVRDHRVSAVR